MSTTPTPPPSIYTEQLPNGITLDMIAIAAGSFIMGSEDEDEEHPPHEVYVPNFYLGKYPITQAQYESIMGTNPATRFNKAFLVAADHPAIGVDWNDAQEFCQRLSQQTDRTYRLPTEAEWEYACRAGTTTRYYCGDDERQNHLKDYAWYGGDWNVRKAYPVGQKKPNAWGLYDMHGNVAEWCADDWRRTYYYKPESLKQNGSLLWLPDHSSENGGPWKSKRGGAWVYSFWECRSASRDWAPPFFYADCIGFRVACSP